MATWIPGASIKHQVLYLSHNVPFTKDISNVQSHRNVESQKYTNQNKTGVGISVGNKGSSRYKPLQK